MEKQTPLTPMVQSFADLKFKVHPENANSVLAKHTFENGTILSVEGGEGFFGSGIHSYEVCACNDKQLFKNGKDWYLLDYASEKQITEVIQMILKNNLK
jgi:hypothetical protein